MRYRLTDRGRRQLEPMFEGINSLTEVEKVIGKGLVEEE